ncbi:MAG: hypothetical protein NC311_06030 [Muribaculaceae bacterium]|nr:hypothetical protein [Muribaculaceae bacterium]
MKKVLLFIGAYCACIGAVNAAVRDATSISRTTSTAKTLSTRNVSSQPRTTVTNTERTNTTARRTQPATTVTRTARNTQPTVARTTSSTISRAATPRTGGRGSTQSGSGNIVSVSRSATQQKTARAATNTQTFGTGYNTCRDAYFTCMDQFCAKQNESYRRCVCSSRLAEIQSRERALGVAADSLQSFHDLNIEVIPKTAAEVKAMLTATAGESVATTKKDNSAAASQLAGISEVLSKTKKSAMSTQGTLDIAGDINAIWSTTDLTGGANIADLTGEALYNAVHAQCATIMESYCPTAATQTMVISAYGMYIENDCSALINSLDKKAIAANSTIRQTEREMQTARLENYNAHNSSSINDCIANVRADITADTACGTDFVHCLDASGRYLNRDTGEPIYTADFYQLETMVSLSGDVLTNQNNRLVVAELQSKRKFAQNSLNTCTDLADDVWDEFMRQALREIYQGQQERIRKVKDECLSVVSACYDEQNQSLKDFSNVKEQLLLGQRLELSEEMCKEKLNACSNLYGDLSLLVEAMHNITDQQIGKQCRVTLQEYAADLCATASNDTQHSYPYACRTYTPGSQKYATIDTCNKLTTSNNTGGSDDDEDSGTEKRNLQSASRSGESSGGYTCRDIKKYTQCVSGYYLSDCGSNTDGRVLSSSQITVGNSCDKCPTGYTCPGGTTCPGTTGAIQQQACGDYVGSLYQKLVRYALNTCVRPSDAENNLVLPTTVLEDVNIVMDQIRIDMSRALATECTKYDGIWITTEWLDGDIDTEDGRIMHQSTGDKKLKRFYDMTGANDKWGYCAEMTDDNADKGGLPNTEPTPSTTPSRGDGGDDSDNDTT